MAYASAELYMVVEYDTEHNLPDIVFNISLSVVDLNVTVIGCADGFYDLPLTKTITCLECRCESFGTDRIENFVVV